MFAGDLLDAFFNLAGVMTGQSILLIGMMTEASTRRSCETATWPWKHPVHAARRRPSAPRSGPNPTVRRERARQVLAEAIDLLHTIGSQGLLTAIAEGTFGVTRRPADGGRGLDGVVARADGYYNPAAQLLESAGSSELRR